MKENVKRFNLGNPDYIIIETEKGKEIISSFSGKFQTNDVIVEMEKNSECDKVLLKAKETPVRFLTLRWNKEMPLKPTVLGDAFERSYGDLEWKSIRWERIMPWYFIVSTQEKQWGYGVKVRPSAMCFWKMDTLGITLILDVRCGGKGVLLNGRTLLAAELLAAEIEGEDSFEAASLFCKMMCSDPVLPDRPIYGANNWYYAYGKSSEEEILKDADNIVRLSRGCDNRPFMVIDDCWQEFRSDEYIGGPWEKENKKFPDMKELARKIKMKGADPGIWFRPLLNRDEKIKEECRISHNGCLDPSHPTALNTIKEDVERICKWGFELIKYDFSTYDLFGKWGFEINSETDGVENPMITEDGWCFYNRSKTSAEIVKDFYRTIFETAKKYNTLILGCNTIGHLGAGFMQISRTGDDISGVKWKRTRKMGVNTLAFRLPQHKAFFEVDADCVGITEQIPWELNRQWADLLAQSGTPFFCSLKPNVLDEKQECELCEILSIASRQEVHKIPVDWKETDVPEEWKDGNEISRYQWSEFGEEL